MQSGARCPRASKLDSFGCPLSKLDDNEQIAGGNIKFYRKSSAAAALGRIETPATNRGFLLGLSMQAGHKRRVFGPHHSTIQEFGENSVYIRDFSEPYKADLSGQFSVVLMEITNTALAAIAEQAEMPSVAGLSCASDATDPVLGGLVGALFSTVGGRKERSALFVDQLSVAIGMHLLHQYGSNGFAGSDKPRALSRRRETQAKDIIQSRLGGDISIDEIAAACNLSSGMFIRAFRETTGKTPHQWLVQQRIEKARDLLLSSEMSLAGISESCGFADQSHFTRVFSNEVGATPGVWRRTRQS